MKTVDEMMVEVEERAKRDVERMEAFERTLENESGAEETEEMKRMRLEFDASRNWNSTAAKSIHSRTTTTTTTTTMRTHATHRDTHR